MFERFTERARKVVVLAQEEAGRFGHNYIGTEHLLLGLLREEDGVATRALASLNVALDEVREQVESIVGFGEGGGRGQVPFTPRSKKVLELALRESMQLGHNYIGTEHILLGLVRESEGVAARVLSNLDVDPDKVRRQVLLMLGEEPESHPLEPVEGAGERETAGNRMLFRGRVGALEVGARVGGLDLTLLVDLDYAYAVRDTDRSSETMDHWGLLDRVVGVLEGGDLGSVEAGIQEAGMASLEHFPALSEIKISATREHALEGRTALDLTVTRTFQAVSRVFLSLGSNIGDRLAYLRAAVTALGRGPRMGVIGTSKVYETVPVEVDEEQPEYLNCVVELECGVPAAELLRYCQGVETALGRDRGEAGEKAPRTVDVDVLLFGEELIEGPDLVVPHRGVTRAFNLVGLADLDPGLYIPGRGAVSDLLAEADRAGIRTFGGGRALLMAVDIGNTQTVLGVFEGEELRGRWRMATEAHRSQDELGAAYAGLLGLQGMRLEEIDSLIVSSDVPELVRSYRYLAEELLGVPFLSVSAGMKMGLEIRYDDPLSLGSDRIVNSVAAMQGYGPPAIIVDFGTATTVEAVDAEKCYLGALMPGVYISLDALATRAAKLRSVDLEAGISSAIATNTPDSIRSGFIYGYAGAVDALIRRFKDELGAPEGVRVVATGGPAPVIVPYCREIETLDPDLTLKGLLALYEMNS